MTTHKLLGQDSDALGPAGAYCICGRREPVREGESVRMAFERHRARSRGRTRRPRPK